MHYQQHTFLFQFRFRVRFTLTNPNSSLFRFRITIHQPHRHPILPLASPGSWYQHRSIVSPNPRLPTSSSSTLTFNAQPRPSVFKTVSQARHSSTKTVFIPWQTRTSPSYQTVCQRRRLGRPRRVHARQFRGQLTLCMHLRRILQPLRERSTIISTGHSPDNRLSRDSSRGTARQKLFTQKADLEFRLLVRSHQLGQFLALGPPNLALP